MIQVHVGSSQSYYSVPVGTEATTTSSIMKEEGGGEDSDEAPPTYDYDYESMYSRPIAVNMEQDTLQLLYPNV